MSAKKKREAERGIIFTGENTLLTNRKQDSSRHNTEDSDNVTKGRACKQPLESTAFYKDEAVNLRTRKKRNLVINKKLMKVYEANGSKT